MILRNKRSNTDKTKDETWKHYYWTSATGKDRPASKELIPRGESAPPGKPPTSKNTECSRILKDIGAPLPQGTHPSLMARKKRKYDRKYPHLPRGGFKIRPLRHCYIYPGAMGRGVQEGPTKIAQTTSKTECMCPQPSVGPRHCRKNSRPHNEVDSPASTATHECGGNRRGRRLN